MSLILCADCLRHFRLHETACPFCGGAARRARPLPAIQSGVSRSRRYAAGAALLGATAACGSDSVSRSADRDAGAVGGTGMVSASGGQTAAGGSAAGSGNAGLGDGGAGGGSGAGGANGGVGNGGASAGGTGTGGVLGDGGVLTSGAVCPGYSNPDGARGASCHGVGDCEPPQQASQVSCVVRPKCEPERVYPTCESDADCAPGWQCAAAALCGVRSCAPEPGPCDEAICVGTHQCTGGSCRPMDCNEPGALPCAAGLECRSRDPEDPSAQYYCAAMLCTEGYPCEPPFACAQGGPRDIHGCGRPPCTTDTDCACGYCIDGACAATLGTCDYQIIATPYGTVWPDEEWV